MMNYDLTDVQELRGFSYASYAKTITDAFEARFAKFGFDGIVTPKMMSMTQPHEYLEGLGANDFNASTGLGIDASKGSVKKSNRIIGYGIYFQCADFDPELIWRLETCASI